jgi:hypothetical protein
MTDTSDTDYTDTNLMGRYVVSIGRQLPTFRIIVPPLSSLPRKASITITPINAL